MPETQDTTHKNIAVIGGGLAGLSSAFALTQADPSATITVFEQGSPQSYNAGNDDVNRASVNASPARIMRMTGATDDIKRSMVRDTKAMIDTLQSDIQAHPEKYDDTSKQPLFTPQASVTILPNSNDAKYHKAVKSLQEGNVAFEELTGAELKQRHPKLYQQLDDTAAVIYESPANEANPNGVAGIMNTPAILSALKGYIESHGGEVRMGQTVTNVKQHDDAEHDAKGVHITTTKDATHFDKAIIAPGQWIEQLVDTDKHDIQVRYDRVVQLKIDLKALGLTDGDIPLTKGLNPEAGKNSLYSFTTNPAADGQAKFISANTTKTVKDLEELRAPVSAEELEKSLSAAAKTLNIEPETLRPHVQAYTCAYTSPKVHENQLVDKIEQDVTLNALDSSATARISGGLGKIAAAHALGLDEPYKCANNKYSLDAHHELINQDFEVKQDSIISRLINTVKQSLGM